MKIDGFYPGIPMDKYHRDLETYSKSSLVDFALKTPRQFYEDRINPPARKNESHYIIGDVVHAAVLEGHDIDKIAVCPPDEVLGKNGARNTKAYKEWAENQPNGTLILKRSEIEQCKSMHECVASNPTVMRYVSGGISEMTAVWTHPSGVRIKVRPDHIPMPCIAVDLKTTVVDLISDFPHQAKKLHYHWSHYLTTAALEALTGDNHRYIFAVVDKTPGNHKAALFEYPQAVVDRAKYECEYQLYRLADAIDRGWPDEIQTLQFPKY
jgi:hypothetical protein